MKKFILSLLLVTPLVCEHVPHGINFSKVHRCENDEVVCYTMQSGWGEGISCKFKEKENVYIPSNMSEFEREPSGGIQES